MSNIYTFEALNKIKIHIKVNKNPYNIPLNKLFDVAVRQNKKRRFLFVSKVLGKHIPVNPALSILTGKMLGLLYVKKLYNEDYITEFGFDNIFNNELFDCNVKQLLCNQIPLSEKTLVIGFAETATALGHSVMDSFNENACYIHTTRETIKDVQELAFEEEHSHATSHRVYPIDFSIIKSNCPIVFVDDEITTGNTVLNFINEIHKKYPRKNYSILTILDWRTQDHIDKYKRLEEELGIKIQVISLLSGEIDIEENVNIDIIINKDKIDSISVLNRNINKIYIDNFFQETILNENNKYLKYTGRFGLTTEENIELDKQIKEASKYLNTIRTGKTILCLGTTEFMYIPMKISAYMDNGIVYHSTTRSPIYANYDENYCIKNAIKFDSPNEKEATNYLYNIPRDYYDEVFIFFEKEYDEPKLNILLDNLFLQNIPKINVIICTKKNKGE